MCFTYLVRTGTVPTYNTDGFPHEPNPAQFASILRPGEGELQYSAMPYGTVRL